MIYILIFFFFWKWAHWWHRHRLDRFRFKNFQSPARGHWVFRGLPFHWPFEKPAHNALGIFSCYTPDIRSMWGYIVFAFPFVRSFVCSYVRLFVRSFVHLFVFPSQGQSFCVKVYKTSYFEDPLMDLVHIWHDGRYRPKIFISSIPTPGVTLGSRSRT